MLKQTTAIFMLGLLSISIASTAVPPAKSIIHATKPAATLLGRWYMGTGTGFDCYMDVQPTTLTVQYGGCFMRQKPIVVAWKREGNRVVFSNAILTETLGSYLSLQSYQGKHDRNPILVPEKEQIVILQYGYVYAHCFWKNTLNDGLVLPRDAKEVGAGPEPVRMPPYENVWVNSESRAFTQEDFQQVWHKYLKQVDKR